MTISPPESRLLSPAPTSEVPPDVKSSSVAMYAVFGALCVMLSDISNGTPTSFIVARIVLTGLLYATLVLPVRTGATLLLLISLAGQDIPSTSREDVQHTTAAIWQLSLGPLNPSAVFFGCLVYQLSRIRLYRPAPTVSRAMVWFLSVPMVSGLLYGGVFSEFGISEYLSDLRFPLMLIGSLLLYGSLLRSHPQWTHELVAALIGVLLARHLIDLIYLAANYGPQALPGVSRSSVDSAKGAVNLLILLGLLSTVLVRRVNRLIGVALVVLFGALSIGYATRLIWLGLVLGVIVLMVMLRPSRIVLMIAVSSFLIVAAASLLTILNPGSALVAAGRGATVAGARPAATFAVDVEYNLLSRIDPIRYGEAINVVESLGRRGAYLWGTGYGGYYEDRAVKFEERRMPTSFPTFMFQAGRFFKTHEFVTHVLLKHGVLGLVLIASVWIVPGVALVRALRYGRDFKKTRPMLMTIIVGALAAYLPTSILQNYWSGKGLFLSGIILALCIHFARERSATIGVHRGGRFVVAPNG